MVKETEKEELEQWYSLLVETGEIFFEFVAPVKTQIFVNQLKEIATEYVSRRIDYEITENFETRIFLKKVMR